jgi:hypothetical protein
MMNETPGKLASAVPIEMPQYRCHKNVWALQIAAVEGVHGASPGWRLSFKDQRYAPLSVTDNWVTKHSPKAGGYFVQYADGYSSYSPQQAFEEGYSQVPQIAEG